ncbi:hypothetical protein ACVWZK_004669 [Bradyrhizobium sp. GM0.4]|uniref:hypothetical protein n=1 Tax=Bradyrhizobium sp. 169 TaxID=2782640 RepID=UPI001FF82A6C|nr:hypothetical protein [Bradyrhizobium sp. 169]MCK1588033.1 hypothetical protein [Bradyrhizobium sp. 169]
MIGKVGTDGKRQRFWQPQKQDQLFCGRSHGVSAQWATTPPALLMRLGRIDVDAATDCPRKTRLPRSLCLVQREHHHPGANLSSSRSPAKRRSTSFLKIATCG